MRLFPVSAVAAAIVTLSASIGVGAADNSPTIIAQATGAASAGGQVGGEANRASASTGGDRNAGLNSKESGTEKLARADRRFVEKAAMGGMLEVELGKLAQSKGAAASVKSFGGKMVEDHGKANQDLMAIASKLGVQPPAQLDRSHQKELDQMSKLSGAEFDKRYMKAMVSHHKKDVSDFEKASKSSKQAELKSFAADKLPTLKEHLKLAQTTEAEVRATKSPS